MKVKALHIPPPNDQKEDPEWDWAGIKIGGGSQCQGNCNEDCIKSIAMEFDIETLKNINTKTYYDMFFGILQSQKNVQLIRNDLMDFRNHAWFMNTLFKVNGLQITANAQSISNDPTFIHRAIERTKRPVSVGTLLTQSGHWIRIHESDSKEKIFYCNDPFGSHPYKREQKGGEVEYSWDYLQKFVLRRAITFEDKKTP